MKNKVWLQFSVFIATGMAMLLGASDSRGGTTAWNNPAGGAWSNPGNWTSGGVPGPADDAFITLDGSYTVTLDTNVIVHSLTVGAANGTQTVTLGASTNLSGTFNFGSNAVFNIPPGTSLGLSGAINNQGTINWDTTNALAGLGNCAISNSGLFNLVTNFSTTNLNGVWLNSGTIQVFANYGPVLFMPSTMDFTNNGILMAGTNSILVLEDNSPNSSRMTFANGTTLNGPGVIQNVNCFLFANGNLMVNGTFELDSDAILYGTQLLNGTGTFNWNGGFIGDYTNTYNYLAVYTNCTTFGSNLVVNMAGGNMNAQVFTNLGTINWLGTISGMAAQGNEVIFNNCGIFVVQRAVELDGGVFPLARFNNYGTILVPTNEYTYLNAHGGWAFTNLGTIEIGTNSTFSMVSSNVINFGDGSIINCAGTFEIGYGDRPDYLVANGTITVNGPLDSPYGLVNLANVFISGTQTWIGTGSIGVGGEYGGGGFVGPGTTTFATNFNVYLSGGAFYLDGHTLNNQGTVGVDFGDEIDDLGHAGTFNNYGTIAVHDYLSLGSDFSGDEPYTNVGSSFNNYGLIQYNSGSGNNSFLNHWQFTNSGTILVGPNDFLFMIGINTTLNDGTVFTGGGQVELDVEHFDTNFTANLLVNGNIQVNTPVTLGYQMVLQGSQTWSGTGSLTWSSGSMAQPGTTTIASNLSFIIADDPWDDYGAPWNNFVGNSYIRTLSQNHVLNIQGTVLWNSSNPVHMTNQAAFQNNGLVLLEGNAELQQLTPDCAFNNQSNGVVRALSGNSTFDCPFSNAGLLDLDGGTLSLSNNLVLAPSSRSQFALGGPLPSLAAATLNAGGVLSAVLPGGYSVTNGTTFALANFTANSGSFATTQLPPLPPSLQWQLDYEATTLTLEVVNAPTRISAPTRLPNGTFQFTLSGAPGKSYTILVSTNLIDWVPLQTNGAFLGQTNFTDSTATNFPKRFYRAVIGN